VQAAAWALRNLHVMWADPPRRRALLSLLEAVESTPAAIAASFHILAVARA
jgi:hypothetical protein